MLSAAVTTRPRPLEVIPAQPAGDIQRFANSKKTRITLRLKGLGGKFIGADTAQRYLGCAITLCSPGLKAH